MQPELEPEELQEPVASDQHTPPPNSSPAARPALLERTYLFIKEQKLAGVAENLPADYQDFEEGILSDPGNLRALHEVFKKEKWEGAELDEKQFSELLLGGLKKKAQSPAGGTAAGATSATGGPISGPASPTPATPTPPSLPGGDEEFLPEGQALPGGPEPVGVGQVPAPAEPAPALVEAQNYPAYLAADPERYAAAVEAERPKLGVVPDGYERVALPPGAAGPDAEGTYMARNSQTGQRYLDRPLSKEVPGEGEQGLLAAAGRNMGNLMADGFKGLFTAADDATRLISNATGLERGGAFADVAGGIETLKKPVAPYYQSHDLMAHPNAKNLLMATSDVAGMAVPILAQALAPEAGLGRVAARVIGTGAGLMFDGQILQGAHDRATAAGMSPDQAAAYTFLEGGLSIALFKGGGALLGQVGGKLTPDAVKSEILRETYRILADRGGKQLTRQELAGVLQQATAAATPRLLKVAAEGGKLGTLFGVNEAKNILTEAAARQTIGAKFTAPTLGEAVKRVAGAATEGAVIGSLTGAALPSPKRTLPLGQTPEGRPLSVELNAAGEPERFLDDQGPVDFGPQGPPPAVQAAVARVREANPVPLPAGEMLSHQKIPVGAHTVAGPLFADYDLAGKAVKLYSEKGQVLTPALDDPQVRALVESKRPGAPKPTADKPQEKPAPAPEAPAVSAQTEAVPVVAAPAALPEPPAAAPATDGLAAAVEGARALPHIKPLVDAARRLLTDDSKVAREDAKFFAEQLASYPDPASKALVAAVQERLAATAPSGGALVLPGMDFSDSSPVKKAVSNIIESSYAPNSPEEQLSASGMVYDLTSNEHHPRSLGEIKTFAEKVRRGAATDQEVAAFFFGAPQNVAAEARGSFKNGRLADMLDGAVARKEAEQPKSRTAEDVLAEKSRAQRRIDEARSELAHPGFSAKLQDERDMLGNKTGNKSRVLLTPESVAKKRAYLEQQIADEQATIKELDTELRAFNEPANPEPQPLPAGGPASPAEPTTLPTPTDGIPATPGADAQLSARASDISNGANPNEGMGTPAAPLGSGPDREIARGSTEAPLLGSKATVADEAAAAVSDSGARAPASEPTPKPYATPAENRAAGAFEKDGQVYTRQAPLGEKVARGKQATAEFSSGVQQPVQYAVMEAADLQPSHLGGSQNLNHFLPEAQPKNRSAAYDPASQKAIADIAASPDLGRLGEAPNAYSGAPIVNQRGEALQGNGRAAGVREHYRTGGESYKRDVVAAAEKAGIPAAETARFKEPVLVRIADVSDAKGRELGNYTAADTESGGKRRLDARQASGRLDEEGRTTLARLATPRGEATLTETIRANGEALLRFLRTSGLVNETQLQTMVKGDGTLTPSGVEDVAALYRHQLFRDGDPNLPELYAELPAAAQGGLDRAVGALLGVPEEASIVPDVQDALYGVREFLASGTDFNTWAGQADMFKGGLAPRERYSPLALKLVEKLTTEKRPTYIAKLFNEYATAVTGEGASLFGETPPKPRAEAVRATFGVADERAPGNSRPEEGAPRPGDADQRPEAPEPPAAPGADGQGEASPRPDGADTQPAGAAGVEETPLWQQRRADYLASRPNQVSEADAPTLADLSSQLKAQGAPGIALESGYTSAGTPDAPRVQEPIEGEKYVVLRGADGAPLGVLEMSFWGPEGLREQPQSLKIAVTPAERGKGVAQQLFAAAEKAGFAVEAVSGKETTQAGAGARHKRAVAQALAQGLTVPAEVMADYPTLQTAELPAARRQRPPAPEPPAVPGADGAGEALPSADERTAEPAGVYERQVAEAKEDALQEVRMLGNLRRILDGTQQKLKEGEYKGKDEKQEILDFQQDLEKQITKKIADIRHQEWRAGNQVTGWRILDDAARPIESAVTAVEKETGTAPVSVAAELPAARRQMGGYVARDGTRFTGAGAKVRAEAHSREMSLVGKRVRAYGGGTDTVEQVVARPDGSGYTYTVRNEAGEVRTHGTPITDEDVKLAAKDDLRGSGPKFYADLAEAPPVMAQPGRIAPDPIRGEKPKAQDQIVLDLRKGSSLSLVFSKRPGGRKGSRALGSYNPRNAAVTVKAATDLDVTAHELGHALDDAHDLLPTASPAALAEIQPLARFGSKPPAGHPDPQQYRDGEALAEYVRAYLVNPAATRVAYPEFTKHYEATVPAAMRAKVEAFGRDIRVFAGATAHEQVMSNVRMKPVEKTGIMGILKPSTVGNGGKFLLTFGDRVQATMLNALHPFEKAMRYAQDVTGQDVLPADNPTVLARLFAGLNDKMDNQMREGLVDSRNQRRIDPQTGQVKNLTWLLDPLDKTTAGTIEAEQELVVSAKIARRTVELVERRVAEDIEAAHARGESVPDALLQQKPEWAQQFGAENTRLKALPGNVEATIDEHQADTVTGVGAGVFTDLAVARQRLADHDALAVRNPAQHARIEEAGRRYESWADDNLRYLLERGRIGQEQYDAIKENNAQYIAMQRIMEAEPGAEIEIFGRGPGGKSFTAVKQPLQKITGSGRTIKNPYSSLLDATYRVTREGDRNAIMQSFRELFTGSRTMYDGQAEDLAAVARPAAEGDPNTVSVFVAGKREYWQLDADVHKALTELSNTPLDGPLAKVLQAPAKLLRWTVTNSPVFAVRNLIRDTRSRLIVSTNRPERGFDVLTNKQARAEARDGLDLYGGGQAGHYLSSETAYYDTMQGEMRRLSRDKRMILADPKRWAEGAWHSYTRLLGGSETLGRRMEYRAAFKEAQRKGLDDYNASLHAALEARDLMDFAVAGTFMREVNKYVPFTNAAVQGLRRAARSVKENPGGFATRWALYSLVPTLLVRGLVHQLGRDEEYAQLPAYQRDGFDNIPLPQGKWLVIPRPFELGTMAASADRFLSQQVADDPQAWAGYLTGSTDNNPLNGSVGKSFFPVDESAVAGGLKPVLEVLTNHDFFKDKTIISPAEAKLDVDLRHTERGSRLGQWVGGAVGMDSRNVDHLVSGLGSYYGNWLLKASNFGREDGGQSFGLPDTGFLKEQPVTQARDVQWMQRKLEEAGLGQSKPARDLGKLLEFYYAQKTPEGKRQAGELATAYARTLRDFLDAELLKQVGQAKKAQREAKK